MANFWINSGKLVIDALGKLVTCATCPCVSSVPCTDCTGVQPVPNLSGSTTGCPGSNVTPDNPNWLAFSSGTPCNWHWNIVVGSEATNLIIFYNTTTSVWSAQASWGSTTDNITLAETISGVYCSTGGILKGSFTMTTFFGGTCSSGTITVDLDP